jgi:predicted amidophosphoribosyltransferase
MTTPQNKRGGAPVGFITELDSIEAASVIYLRLWCDGPETQSQICADFTNGLGTDQGRKAFQAFEELCNLCARHGRRPLMRHSVQCKCIGADESCFANFVATATDGEREDALLIATLLVRPDVAPLIASLASNFGLALKQMHLAAPRSIATTNLSSTMIH